MKEILFDETQLEHLNQLAQELFNGCDDPRSSRYRRVLVRPTIHWGKIAGIWVAALLLGCLLYIGLRKCGASTGISAAVTLAGALLVGWIHARRGLICAIRIYQRYAPDSLRNKCRFEPSCSQYMILALEKYGLLRGLRKGIDRLKRCNPEGGGYDNP